MKEIQRTFSNANHPASAAAQAPGMAMNVLSAISVSHLLNDMIQSLILALYPLFKGNFQLSFGQIGLITLTYQLTASMLQPVVGAYTDRNPKPWSLPVGMSFTLVGLLLLSVATDFPSVLLSAALVGTGSSIFHPESSRVARMASGGQHGFAQSLFQVGGNLGSALGPLLAAAFIVPHGQGTLAWFSLAALLAILILIRVSRWYAHQHRSMKKSPTTQSRLPRSKVILALGLLLTLIFSKFFYAASISSYLTFYLMSKFQVSVQAAQIYLFVFLFATAAGTLIGGPIGDRVGRKYVIWGSILGIAPLTIALPYANLLWTGVLLVPIGLILASAFSAMLVYAQELIPGRVGTVSGLFFGLAFGMGGIGAAALGALADRTSIDFVYRICAWLPMLGIVAMFLPDLDKSQAR